ASTPNRRSRALHSARAPPPRGHRRVRSRMAAPAPAGWRRRRPRARPAGAIGASAAGWPPSSARRSENRWPRSARSSRAGGRSDGSRSAPRSWPDRRGKVAPGNASAPPPTLLLADQEVTEHAVERPRGVDQLIRQIGVGGAVLPNVEKRLQLAQ